jgi:hypothetical protein
MSAGQLARLTGVSTDSLRHYEPYLVPGTPRCLRVRISRTA